MPIALHRYFRSDRTAAGAEKETVARVAKIVACGALLVGVGYFVLLYLLTSR